MLFLKLHDDKGDLASIEIGAGILAEVQKAFRVAPEAAGETLLTDAYQRILYGLKVAAETEGEITGEALKVAEVEKRKAEFEANVATATNIEADATAEEVIKE